MRWGRLLVGFFYVLATGCAIVLLVLSWRNEVDRRRAAETRAAASVSSLNAANEKLQALEAENTRLSTRLERLGNAATSAQRTLGRRTRVLRDVRGLLATTEDFVAALDGLDEILGDTVKTETGVRRPEARLGVHVAALDQYLRTTSAPNLDRSVLRARVRALTNDLESLRSVISTLTAGKNALDEAVEPLRKTKELDRALQATIARAKAALRR
jgi:prefoldin subunit 5